MRNLRLVLVLLVFGVGLALGMVALAWAVGPSSSEAQGGTMHNCPQPGKWAIAVWDGDDGTDIDEALAACGEAEVVAAYSIDPDTQVWSRWFAEGPGISNLTTLDEMEGIIALAGAPRYEVTVRFNTSVTQDDIDEVAALLRAYDEDLEFLIMESWPPIGRGLLATNMPDFCQTVEAELGAKSYVDDVSCQPRKDEGGGEPDAPVQSGA